MPDELINVVRFFRQPDGSIRQEVLHVRAGPDDRGWYRLTPEDHPYATVVMRDGGRGWGTKQEIKVARDALKRGYDARVMSLAEGIARAKIAKILRINEELYIAEVEKKSGGDKLP